MLLGKSSGQRGSLFFSAQGKRIRTGSSVSIRLSPLGFKPPLMQPYFNSLIRIQCRRCGPSDLCSFSSSPAFFVHPSQAEPLFLLPDLTSPGTSAKFCLTQCLIYYGACRKHPHPRRVGTKSRPLPSPGLDHTTHTQDVTRTSKRATDGATHHKPTGSPIYNDSSGHSGHDPMQISSLFDVSPTVDAFTHYYRKLTLQPIQGRSRT